jgi:hypothetical protein
MRSISYLINLSLLLSFLVVNSLWADGNRFLDTLSKGNGNLKFGLLKIHPGLAMENSYDDNIYNTAADTIKDYINTTLAGMYLSFGDKSKLDLGYAANINRYNTHKDENFVGHDGRLALDLNSNMGIKLLASDVFVKSTAPRDRIDNPLRASYIFNGISSYIGYDSPSSKFGAKISYRQNDILYDNEVNKVLNKRDIFPGLELKFKIMPKTEIFTRYEYGLEKYLERDANDANNMTHKVLAGIRWDIKETFDAEIGGGYFKKDFVNSTLEDKGVGIFSADIGLMLQVLGKTRFFILGDSSIETSEYPGSLTQNISGASFYQRTAGGGGLTWQIRYRMEFFAKGT